MEHQHRRFLIVRTDRIGDVLLTLPMARVLKRRFPGCHVAMLIHSYTSDLVTADPDVDEVIAVPHHRPPLAETSARLRRSGFDAAFHTHPRPRFALISALARIPIRVGTGYRWYSLLFNRRVYEHRKDARRHELEYNLNLLRAIGLDPPWGDVSPRMSVGEANERRASEALTAAGVPGNARFAILHPGSGGSARDWPAARFARLAEMLAARDGLTVVLTGGPGEEGLVESVRSRCGRPVRTITGLPGIRDYAALAGRAALFIANSTGPIHVAAAMGVPVVGLYPQVTPLSAARWGPWTERKTVLSPEGFPPDCSACEGGGTCACMDSIDPARVYDAAARLLGAEAAVA